MALVSREIMIGFGLLIAAAAIPVVTEHWHFLMYGEPPSMEEMEHIIDGMAGILVAIGVFFESRETIRALARHTKEEISQTEIDLNEVAHHNGLGLLIIGLFMEIGTLLIGMPQRLIATKHLEIYMVWACFFLTIASIVILFDFIKDFVRSYFGKRPS